MTSSSPAFAPPRHASRRTAPLAATLALATALAGMSLAEAAPAHAAPGDPLFTSSFESGDPTALTSTPYGTQTNLAGATFTPGSVLRALTSVTASAENPPSEVAAALSDGVSSTKWLARENTGWIVYRFAAPQKVTGYTLTSANDSPERDPRAFALQGSADGTTWTDLDTQTDQTFSARFATNRYTLTSAQSFAYYRLNITANSGDSLIQLADWDLIDATSADTATSAMITAVGAGPVSGYNMRSSAGYSGVRALRYAGSAIADGAATGANELYDVNVPIAADTRLNYKIFPVLDDALSYASTYSAVDLLFTDGTRMSAAGLTDSYGFDATARAQGEGKVLYGSQWNSVTIDLGSLAGRTIDKILFAYDHPGLTAGQNFSGWIDDISLAPAVKVDDSSLVNWVDTRRGTHSSGAFSRGNNLVATAVPNGFNFFVPMTNTSSEWLYSWAGNNTSNNLPQLQGIGISHQPSPWMGDRNQLAIMPSTSATPNTTPSGRSLEFSHTTEIARPDLYSVQFTNGLVTEVTPTDHGGMYRFQFPGDTGSVIFDRVNGRQSGLTVSGSTLSGWVDGGSGLSAGASRMFIAGTFDATPTNTTSGSGTVARATFDTSGNKLVQLRIATSFISQAQAEKNLALEVTGRSFADIQKDAAAAWNERLGVIEVEGATDAERTTLYSNLYRLNLYPNSQFENTGTAANPTFQYASPVAPTTGSATATQTNAKIVDGKIYVNNGFWDTYRTAWPAYSLLYPEISEELIDGFVQQYRDGGWIARWSSPGYADLMTGTSSDVSFADAYLNGTLDTATALDAYDAALKNATVLPESNAVGRKGLDRSIFLGYTPADTHESVSWGLEGGTNDYGIALMAKKLATDPAVPNARKAQLTEEATYFLERSYNYVNLFDSDADFFQARRADGSWNTPSASFDPESWGGAFTETNGWNFAFHAPYDIDGLAALYGGTDGLIAKLDTFFTTPERANKPGGYGSVIHEMLEARDVRMGQLGQSNQVSHHIPYLYAAAGDPSKTQAAVREITQRLYVGSDIGQGYPGDEDNGEMSAWYIFSALGFYPMAVGSGEYVIGSPSFTKATVNLPGGKKLVINAAGNSPKNVYVQSASFNGTALTKATLPTTALLAGGTLNFQMGANPSTWGDRTSDQGVRIPHVDVTTPLYGATTSTDGTATAALVDDNSRSTATFSSATPSLQWTSGAGNAALTSYTITNGATGAAPSAWTLDGSADGTTWVNLDSRTGEQFRWASQTRPFQITTDAATPPAYAHYRLSITATSTGEPATLGEIELLSDPSASSGDFRLEPAPAVSGRVGVEVTAPLAVLSGAVSGVASGYTATVDFLDGAGPQKATLTRTPLGAWQVAAPHTFPAAGSYTARVTVTEGQNQASIDTTISITRDDSLVGAFDSICIGEPGVAANCDQLAYGYPRAGLADGGFVQGTTVSVPGTTLTFDLPAIPAGQPDNATGRGQTIAVDLGEGATQLSLIGTATEKALQRTGGTVNFTDGTSIPLTIEFGDWTAQATSPRFGNTVVVVAPGRTAGANGTDGARPAIYATAPLAIPEGKTVASITMPVETGDPRGDGRIHVFAIASDGTRTASANPLAATGSPVAGQTTGTEFTQTLATATGGKVGAASTATINWGDATGTTAGAVSGTDAGARIAGTHTYAAAGTYTVTVTVDDGATSAATTTTIEVTDPVTYTPSLTLPTEAVRPGALLTVTGAGFAPGETVTVTLASVPDATVDVVADGAGAISAGFTVPASAADGSYPITARGGTSGATAQGTVTIAKDTTVNPGTDPSIWVSAASARRGDTLQVTATGYLPGETVRIILHSDPVTLGEGVANGNGVLSLPIAIPSDAVIGEHAVEALGLTSARTASAPLTIATALPPTVTPERPAPGGYQGLASSGLDAEQQDATLSIGIGALLLGAAAVVLGWWLMRRRSTQTD